ncbi:hypothetical protein B0H14DRAFT_2346054, partial [Mycena olivaceomarginata]
AIEDTLGENRPRVPLRLLAALAIFGSDKRRLSLKEIYAALRDRFVWFRGGDNRWTVSVRRTLSLHRCFKNVGREPHAVGRGGEWELTN